MIEGQSGDLGGSTLKHLAIGQLVCLRGPLAVPQMAAHIARITGLALPMHANSRSVDATQQLLWIGPDEWWWLDRAQSRPDRVARLVSEAPGPIGVVALGDAYRLLSVRGTAAADLLSRGCPIDLHPRAFGPSQVVGSVFHKAEIRLWRTLDDGLPAGFEFLVRRSMAAYVQHLLGFSEK